jgi:hypothetical protein
MRHSPASLFIPYLLCCVFAVTACQSEKPSEVKIKFKGKGWNLYVNNTPYYIKGITGWSYFERAKQAGANAVRISADRKMADSASHYGFMALVNLPVYGERDGMDWNNDSLIGVQTENVLRKVKELKNHPAVLFWALGNELDWIPPGKPYNPRMWSVLDSMAMKIHELDPGHPVLTVIGDSDFEKKIQEISEKCPRLDLIGLNGYGSLGRMMFFCKRFLEKPVIVTEWGVTGYWERPHTAWGAAVEESSKQKTDMYFDRYQFIIRSDTSRCLGSFVFLWGKKQEITHTWFGLFDEQGNAAAGVDVMEYFWKGKWPANRAPFVDSVRIASPMIKGGQKFAPGTELEAWLVVTDFDKDSLRFTWEIKPEVKPGIYAGSGEIPAKAIAGLIEDNTLSRIRFRTPSDTGAYRLFVYVYDNHRHFSSDNIPFWCGPLSHEQKK